MSNPLKTGLIGFGSNQGNSEQIFIESVRQLSSIAGVVNVVTSEPIWTQPVTGQPTGLTAASNPYLNAAIRLETNLDAKLLHQHIQQIEQDFGRVRQQRWADRTIDLDLLLLGGDTIESPSLTLPHPRMTFRRFVLQPAAQIAPDLIHPVSGCTLGQLLGRIDWPLKTMGIVAPPGVASVSHTQTLLDQLAESCANWTFEKIFSKKKYLTRQPKLMMVVVFDVPGVTASGWKMLREKAIHFPGPSLRLQHALDHPAVITELLAAIQTID